MPRSIIQEKCNNCGICYESCPVEAVIKIGNTYSILQDDCVDCGTCQRICKCEAVEGLDPIYVCGK